MRKTGICLILLVFLLMGSVQTAWAESYTGSGDRSVEFDGESMKSTFKSGSLADSFPEEFQPGDDITLTVHVKSTAPFPADWYMTSEILRTLEESRKGAAGGSCTYRLSWQGPGEQRVLYDSETVGGEQENGTEAGLREVTESLEEFVYLDRLEKGESGTVYLYLKVDGETQGNDYQNTLADLQMNFAAETVAKNAGERVETEGTEASGTKAEKLEERQKEQKPGRSAVRTGDMYRTVPWAIAALVSGLVLLVLAAGNRKREKEEQ